MNIFGIIYAIIGVVLSVYAYIAKKDMIKDYILYVYNLEENIVEIIIIILLAVFAASWPLLLMWTVLKTLHTDKKDA